MKRPLTQRELRALKQNQQKSDSEKVVIINRSKNQTVPIQLKAPAGVDWFVGEQTIMLYPQRQARFPKHRLYSAQIENHQKHGRIQVIKSSS